MVGGGHPFYLKFWVIADFEPIFTRSTSSRNT